MESGVYIIRNSKNSRVYIGSAAIFKVRFKSHKYDLVKNKHHSRSLQNFVNKYGFETLSFDVLEFCEKEFLIEREQYWIDTFQSADSKKGYNICPTAGNCLGRPVSDATKLKISKAHTGRKLTEQHCRQIAERQKGKLFSEERKQKMRGKKRTAEQLIRLSLARTGRPSGGKGLKRTEEQNKRNSDIRRGVKHSEATLLKMSLSQKGRKHTPEHIQKGSLAKTGVKRSEESKMRMSLAQTGKKHSEESKSNQSKAMRGRPLSEAHKDKLRNKVVSEEARLNMSEAAKKKPPITEETRLKMSEGQKRRQSNI